MKTDLRKAQIHSKQERIMNKDDKSKRGQGGSGLMREKESMEQK